jgi:phage anti-repressor protein
MRFLIKSEMTSLNIVELIENNPITRLSNTYQGKLLTKIKDKFNTQDQQLFVASFYSYLNCDSKKDFVINLDNVWEWLDFSHKHKAKILLEKNFVLDTDYKHSLNLKVEQKKGRGGHNKETIMLTINAFKRFCLKAGTKKADQIHNYYINLEETLHEIVNEESNELKLQLEQIKTQSKKTIENLTKEKSLEKHNILLREFGNAGALVYIIRVKSYENGEYIIKIGESRRGIEARYNEHKTKYEETVLLDCFLVKRSRDFEHFLHNHDDIRFNNVKDLVGHESERELFIVGKTLSYGVLLNIIKKNINQFNDVDYSEIINRLDVISGALTNQPVVNQSSPTGPDTNNNNLIIDRLSKIEVTLKEIVEKMNTSQNRTTTGFERPLSTVGPRLQKINPETMQLVKVYETVSECMREDGRMKRPSINKAVEKNVLYNGFRWAFVDRELDPNIIHGIKETVKTRPQDLGYIAKLNANKTQIINVYLDRKTAAVNNGYSHAALDVPVKKGKMLNGYYYALYEKCPNELKSRFSMNTPILYKDGVGQFDSQNRIVQEFKCKYDCIKTLKMSDRTLTKALDKNVAYQGFYYKSLGNKLQL